MGRERVVDNRIEVVLCAVVGGGGGWNGMCMGLGLGWDGGFVGGEVAQNWLPVGEGWKAAMKSGR